MEKHHVINIAAVILYQVKMKLKTPFITSYGKMEEKEFLVIEVQDEDGLSGWGETAAFSTPWYTEETVRTNEHLLLDFLIPLLLKRPLSHPTDLLNIFAPIRGNHMAKAALEGAVWDLYAKQKGLPLYRVLGGEKQAVEAGVSIGIQNSVGDLLKVIEGYVEEGYRRIKVKIKPGWDVEVLKEIRRHFPNVPLMVDANAAYRLEDAEHLKALDQFNLLMIEQPLAHNDLVDHAQLQKQLTTPICLDESIASLEDVRVATLLGSCQIINLKLARVGGLSAALRIHQYCQKLHIPLWCGGMLEAGIGRAHNIALATLGQFQLPGDLSASDRYWEEDIIEPDVRVQNGLIHLPEKPGLGYKVNRKVLAKYTYQIKIIRSKTI